MAILLQLKNLQVDNIDFDENMGFRNIKTTYLPYSMRDKLAK